MSIGNIKNGKLVSLQSGHFPQLFTGLDASKPTPALGDYYFTTDNGKIYTCFIAGYWTLIQSQGYEEYQNHLGNVDNYIETTVTGSGTATEAAATHKMILSAGIAVGSTLYQTKDTFIPSSDRQLLQIKIRDIIETIDGTGYRWIGFREDFTSNSGAVHFVGFYQAINVGSQCYAAAFGTGGSSITPVTLSDKDVLGVAMTSSLIEFYQNGALIKTINTKIPTKAMHAGGSIVVTSGITLPPVSSFSIDYIMIRRY